MREVIHIPQQVSILLKNSVHEVVVVPSETRVVEVPAQGPPGPPGELAVGSGDLSYLHEQTTAAAVWTIQHNLGKYPSVTVVDSAGDECEGGVDYVGLNTVILTFSLAFSGRAFLN